MSTSPRQQRERGSIIIELSLYLPILTLVLMGGFEMAHFSLLSQKLHRAATLTADYTAQTAVLDQTVVDDLFAASSHIADPFPLLEEGRLILSVVALNGATPEVSWQAARGDLNAESRIGTVNNPASLPDASVVRDEQPLVVAEIVYTFRPRLFPQILAERQLYTAAFYRPRRPNLTVAAP